MKGVEDVMLGGALIVGNCAVIMGEDDGMAGADVVMVGELLVLLAGGTFITG